MSLLLIFFLFYCYCPLMPYAPHLQSPRSLNPPSKFQLRSTLDSSQRSTFSILFTKKGKRGKRLSLFLLSFQTGKSEEKPPSPSFPQDRILRTFLFRSHPFYGTSEECSMFHLSPTFDFTRSPALAAVTSLSRAVLLQCYTLYLHLSKFIPYDTKEIKSSFRHYTHYGSEIDFHYRERYSFVL